MNFNDGKPGYDKGNLKADSTKTAESAPVRASKPTVDSRPNPSKPEVSKFVMVACELCNIRSEANPTSKILKEAPKGAEFKFLGNQNGYVKVSVDGDQAFIRQDLVKVYDNPANAAK
jgi:uncharacterized protein YgiM (DUF1202 family)